MYYPLVYPIIFQVGPITIYSFGTLMALAALAAGWIIWLELQRCGYNPEFASTLVVAAAVGGLVGARVLFIVEEWRHFTQAPLSFIFSGSGLTWYGGLFGGALAVGWMVRRAGIPLLRGADIAAPALALAYGIGRIGCHVAGDGDWGTITDVPWGVAYTNAIFGWVHPLTGEPYPAGIKVHPTPLYEFIESLIVFGVLWGLRKKELPAGTLFWLYLVLSGLARFGVEFWRVNRVLALGMTEAQWVGLLLAVAGTVMLYRSRAPA